MYQNPFFIYSVTKIIITSVAGQRLCFASRDFPLLGKACLVLNCNSQIDSGTCDPSADTAFTDAHQSFSQTLGGMPFKHRFAATHWE